MKWKEYKYVISDYFVEFVRGFKLARLGLIAYIAVGTLYMNWIDAESMNWMGGIPIIFALMSGAFHMVSLPMMMYLVPYTQEKREQYIERMLYVKIGIPMIFAVVVDLIAAFIQPLSGYALLLQLIAIFLITYITGTLNDGTVDAIEKKAAYGGFRDFVAIPIILCYIAGPVMFMICSDSISKTEFLVILGVMGAIFLPIINFIRKRWKRIRANFADYEMSGKLEVR